MAELDIEAAARTRARYDRIAPVYDLMEALMERAARRWRELLWARVEGEKILEVGVGTGKNMPYYPKGRKLTAIDLSAKMLKRARRRAERMRVEVELMQMDAQALDFPDKSFDTVVASFVFCSVPDPVQGLRELGRVASGKILLLEHMRPRSRWLGKLFDLLNPVTARLFGFNINRRTLENVRKAGLKVDGVQDLDRLGIVKLIVARPTGTEQGEERRMKMADYSYGKRVEIPFEEALERVKAELAQEGFGVLAEIDVQKTLKEKLGVDFPKYVILGACNPPNAKRSLDLEREIGLLLPCNLIVYEHEGKTHVAMLRPTEALKIVENKALDELAREVEAKLKRALDRV